MPSHAWNLNHQNPLFLALNQCQVNNMRRNKKLFASGFSQFQAKQGSERKRSRSVARYFFNEINPLEGRVLLTAITINSQADLATYFHSSTNSYSIDAGNDSVTIASNIIINTSSATG